MYKNTRQIASRNDFKITKTIHSTPTLKIAVLNSIHLYPHHVHAQQIG
jgi:hypothetical protein